MDRFSTPSFPAVHRIEGVVEMLDDTWNRFKELRGGNASGYITATGSWNPRSTDSKDSSLTFKCHDVPLNV